MFKKVVISSIIFVVFCLTVFAEDNTEYQFNSSIDVSILSLDYDKSKAAGNRGVAGTVSLNKIKLFRKYLALSLTNKDKVLDSNIFVREGFFGFKGPYSDIGFSVTKDDLLSKLEKAVIKTSSLKMDSKKITMSSEFVKIDAPKLNLKIENIEMFCKKHPSFQDISMDALFASCLMEGTLNGRAANEFATLELMSDSFLKEGVSFDLSTKFRNIAVSENRIEINSDNFEFIFNKNKKLMTEGLLFDCKKETRYTRLNYSQLLETCLNEMNIAGKRIAYADSVDQINYEIFFDKVSVKRERLTADTLFIQIKQKLNYTKIYNLKLDCAKDKKVSDLNVLTFTNGCIKDSSLYIERMSSNDKPGITDKTSNIKKINLTVKEGVYELKAKVRWLLLNFPLKMQGNISIETNEEKVEISITVEKSVLPFGIRSRELLFYFIKKYMVSDKVRIDKASKKIYIDITPKEV